MPQTLSFIEVLRGSLQGTFRDVLPIILVIGLFQLVVLKKKIPHFRQILLGFFLVILGLSLFLLGLEEGIFPVGIQMAEQLSHIEFPDTGGNALSDGGPLAGGVDASLYFQVYIFAFALGFSTTLAEPALIAIAMKARDISIGAISPWGLRLSVALGVAIGITLGTYRIVAGSPLYLYIISGYAFLLAQTFFAPKLIVPLAYDCGGVTTSTVTVPLVVALGIGLSSNVPGRNPLIDGFGLIAFASLFPMITVLGYAMIGKWRAKRDSATISHE